MGSIIGLMMRSYLQLRTFLRIRMRASIPWESKRCDTNGRSVWTAGETMLKNTPHLVKFDHGIIVSLWTFQPTIVIMNLLTTGKKFLGSDGRTQSRQKRIWASCDGERDIQYPSIKTSTPCTITTYTNLTTFPTLSLPLVTLKIIRVVLSRGHCPDKIPDPTMLSWQRMISTDCNQYSWAFALSLATLPD